jgi:hypothetical protein
MDFLLRMYGLLQGINAASSEGLGMFGPAALAVIPTLGIVFFLSARTRIGTFWLACLFFLISLALMIFLIVFNEIRGNNGWHFYFIVMIPLWPILFVFVWALLALISLFKNRAKNVALAAVFLTTVVSAFYLSYSRSPEARFNRIIRAAGFDPNDCSVFPDEPECRKMLDRSTTRKACLNLKSLDMKIECLDRLVGLKEGVSLCNQIEEIGKGNGVLFREDSPQGRSVVVTQPGPYLSRTKLGLYLGRCFRKSVDPKGLLIFCQAAADRKNGPELIGGGCHLLPEFQREGRLLLQPVFRWLQLNFAYENLLSEFPEIEEVIALSAEIGDPGTCEEIILLRKRATCLVSIAGPRSGIKPCDLIDSIANHPGTIFWEDEARLRPKGFTPSEKGQALYFTQIEIQQGACRLRVQNKDSLVRFCESAVSKKSFSKFVGARCDLLDELSPNYKDFSQLAKDWYKNVKSVNTPYRFYHHLNKDELGAWPIEIN